MSSKTDVDEIIQREKLLARLNYVQGFSETEGTVESPIDVDIRMTTPISMPKLNWYNYEHPPKKIKATNTGHTVIVSAKWFKERPFLMQGPLMSSYVFNQLHFHWGTLEAEGSEHTVEGKRQPLEMHIVHFKSSYTTQNIALRERDGLVVLVFFFMLQSHDNPAMSNIVDTFSHITSSRTSVRIRPFPLTDLVPTFSDDYYLYWGAVTTPSCLHHVMWVIGRELLGISQNQLAKFRLILDKNGEPLPKSVRKINRAPRTVFHANASSRTFTTLVPTVSGIQQNISRLGLGHQASTIGVPPIPVFTVNNDLYTQLSLGGIGEKMIQVPFEGRKLSFHTLDKYQSADGKNAWQKYMDLDDRKYHEGETYQKMEFIERQMNEKREAEEKQKKEQLLMEKLECEVREREMRVKEAKLRWEQELREKKLKEERAMEECEKREQEIHDRIQRERRAEEERLNREQEFREKQLREREAEERQRREQEYRDQIQQERETRLEEERLRKEFELRERQLKEQRDAELRQRTEQKLRNQILRAREMREAEERAKKEQELREKRLKEQREDEERQRRECEMQARLEREQLTRRAKEHHQREKQIREERDAAERERREGESKYRLEEDEKKRQKMWYHQGVSAFTVATQKPSIGLPLRAPLTPTICKLDTATQVPSLTSFYQLASNVSDSMYYNRDVELVEPSSTIVPTGHDPSTRKRTKLGNYAPSCIYAKDYHMTPNGPLALTPTMSRMVEERGSYSQYTDMKQAFRTPQRSQMVDEYTYQD